MRVCIAGDCVKPLGIRGGSVIYLEIHESERMAPFKIRTL